MLKKKEIIAIGILAVLILGFSALYLTLRPRGVEGEKIIYLEVSADDRKLYSDTIKTEQQYLGPALKENDLIEGAEGEFGLFITSVCGVHANEEKQQWWCVTKGGEMVSTGADQTPIEDGDHFELTLKEGYDQ